MREEERRGKKGVGRCGRMMLWAPHDIGQPIWTICNNNFLPFA